MNNLKSLNSLSRYFQIIGIVNQIEKHSLSSEFDVSILKGSGKTSKQSIQKVLQNFPVMVVGCKKDLIDQNRAQYIMINTKVLKVLKSLDSDNFVQYCETGISKLGQMKVSHEDIRLFISRVFGREICLD